MEDFCCINSFGRGGNGGFVLDASAGIACVERLIAFLRSSLSVSSCVRGTIHWPPRCGRGANGGLVVGAGVVCRRFGLPAIGSLALLGFS